jgi:CDP-glycerol glycerophosphotransferase (TagB/SpsB family)
MNFATVAPVVEKLQADSRIEFFLTASENPELLTTIYADAHQPYSLIQPRSAALMRFDAYVTADFLWAKLPRGTRRVQTFHGVAGKYRTVYDSPTDSMRGWDRLFFINRRRLGNFIETGAIDPDSPNIRLIGMPKLDCLVDGSLKREEILSSLGIDPSAKTVLYAPTWSSYSSLSSMGEEIVRRLGAAGYRVIVKLHDRSRQGDQYHSGGVAWGDRLLPLLKETGGMLATGSNSSTYLVAADVLITDHSSVGFEYLLLDRPVIRIHLPDLLEKTDIEPAYVQLLSDASYSVRSVDDVLRAVEESFANPNMKSADRQTIAAEMFYEPGGATGRATSELYQLIELDGVGE